MEATGARKRIRASRIHAALEASVWMLAVAGTCARNLSTRAIQTLVGTAADAGDEASKLVLAQRVSEETNANGEIASLLTWLVQVLIGWIPFFDFCDLLAGF